ncbi:MAG: hypothetical protein JWL69_3743 [Phycisphaerales bacterium]|nr:hypothetical protein [Phycisphaerales bacterium]
MDASPFQNSSRGTARVAFLSVSWYCWQIMRGLAPIPEGYDEFLRELKQRVQTARLQASLSVNRELILLYWQIGRAILSRQEAAGWGAKIVERLAKDLRAAFSDMSGFSRANLMYMRAFAEAYPDGSIVQQVVGQIPWGHNIILIDRVKDVAVRLWYARQTLQFGWSRNILAHQIETDHAMTATPARALPEGFPDRRTARA